MLLNRIHNALFLILYFNHQYSSSSLKEAEKWMKKKNNTQHGPRKQGVPIRNGNCYPRISICPEKMAIGRGDSIWISQRPKGPPGTLLLALGAGGGVISVVLSGLSTSFRHARNSEPACTSVNSRLNSISIQKRRKSKFLCEEPDRDSKENESIDMEGDIN